jgi:hypothetical protein
MSSVRLEILPSGNYEVAMRSAAANDLATIKPFAARGSIRALLSAVSHAF